MAKTTILGEEFDDGKTNPDNPNSNPENPDNGDSWLAKLVGDGRKYKTPEDVAKAYVHLDEFAETLKREKSELEDRLKEEETRQQTMQELLAELRGNKQPAPDPTPKKEEPNVDIAELVDRVVATRLEERERLAKEKATEVETWTKLDTAFNGRDNAKEVVKKYVGNNPDRADLVKRLGVTDPQGLVTLLKENSKQDTFVPPEDGKVSIPFNPSSSGLTWSKAQEIRKKDPKLYYSREFQVKMHKAASENPNFLKE